MNNTKVYGSELDARNKIPLQDELAAGKTDGFSNSLAFCIQRGGSHVCLYFASQQQQ